MKSPRTAAWIAFIVEAVLMALSPFVNAGQPMMLSIRKTPEGDVLGILGGSGLVGIQYATNLGSESRWLLLDKVQATNNPFYYRDAAASNSVSRFYRAFAETQANSKPVLPLLGSQTILEQTPLTLTITATDADLPVQKLTFSLDTGAPVGAFITPEGVFTWTPGEDQGPSTNTVTVRVTDNGTPAASSTETLTLYVREMNEPPAISAAGEYTVSELEMLSFAVTASDPDWPVQKITFSLEPGAPAGASITKEGIFSWTPGEGQGPSTNIVTVKATDSGAPALSSTRSITIYVSEANTPPLILPIADHEVPEMEVLSFVVLATDADLPAQMVTFTLEPGAPDGASITPGGIFEWIPSEGQGPSTNIVTVRATDNGTPALSAIQTMTIYVREVNRAPVIALIEDQTVTELATLSFAIAAADADRPVQKLAFALDAGAPAGASITPEGFFSWTPASGQGPSTNKLVVRVTDDGVPALSATRAFTVIVSKVPPPAVQPMVWIEPGRFLMGSPGTESGREAVEGPQTMVTISRGFWIGKYETTQNDYLMVIGSNPARYNEDLNRPVETVSWDEATNYCGKLTIRERAAGRLPLGYAYRLPTEAEWEYACRAGTTTATAFGNSLGSSQANFDGFYPYGSATRGESLETTAPVGSYAPNAWGLYDMHGNVCEWCQDRYAASLPGGSVTNPEGVKTGVDRVIRGGGWGGSGRSCRSARRYASWPDSWYYDVGFRPVLAPVQ